MSKRPIKKKITIKVDPIDRLRKYVDRENDKIYKRIHEHWKENLLEREKLSNRIGVLEKKSKGIVDIKIPMDIKVDEADIDKKEKVFCKDCAYRIRKFDCSDQCLVTKLFESTDVVTGKTSISYAICNHVNDDSECKKFKQREETFWERRKDGIYNRGFPGIIIPLIIVVIIYCAIALVSIFMEDEKPKYKNKTPVENVKPIGD